MRDIRLILDKFSNSSTAIRTNLFNRLCAKLVRTAKRLFLCGRPSPACPGHSQPEGRLFEHSSARSSSRTRCSAPDGSPSRPAPTPPPRPRRALRASVAPIGDPGRPQAAPGSASMWSGAPGRGCWRTTRAPCRSITSSRGYASFTASKVAIAPSSG